MDFKELLGKVAPTLLSATLGPMAAPALALLGNVLGTDPTPESINEKIKSGQLTGDQITKLKELEQKYQDEEKERGFRYADLEVKDVADARKRDTELAKAGQRNVRADALALVAVVAVVALTIAIWRDPTINEYMKGTVTLVLGRFLGYIDQIYAFEFGTTRSSQKKTDIIARSDAIRD